MKKNFKLTIYLQLVLSIIILVLFVMYLINNKYLSFLELALGLNLLVTGYNNEKVYKRRNLTILYIIFGIVMIVISIIKFLGV